MSIFSQKKNPDDIQDDQYDEIETIGDISDLLSRRPGENPEKTELKEIKEEERAWLDFGKRQQNQGEYTVKTLEYLAWHNRSKNGEYYPWMGRRVQVFLDRAISKKDHYVAELFFKYFSWSFVWSGVNWFYFDSSSHRYHRDGDGLMVMKWLSGKFVERLSERVAHFKAIKENTRDEAQKLLQASYIKNVEELIECLMKNSFKKTIREELKEFYKNSDFSSLRDENQALLVNNNGVLEFKGKKVSFRPGLPEDFCTYSTHINFYWKVDPVKEKFVRVYFNQVYPRKEVRHWMWLYYVSLLYGGTRDKNVTFHLGSGDNSKSAVLGFIKKMLGDYAIIGNNKQILAGQKTSQTGAESGSCEN